ncbi:MAG: tRNA preQ1(34) S-adenosylmethionine ribosyltransferase-isomerase QueA [Acidimicrobiia bacterium]
MLTGDFRYSLPEGSIAQEAIEPRDSARLLVTSTLEDRVFRDLPALLRPHDLVVVNTTRVRAARLTGTRRPGGGAVELLLTRRLDDRLWQCLVRPARRIRAGVALDFGAVVATVQSDPVRGVVIVDLETAKGHDVEEVLPIVGSVPLPPYFHGSLPDPERYQTMFAKEVGSAAAPTAALHFTPDVVAGLAARGVDMAQVRLDVGLDTFRPIQSETLEEHVMHAEHFTVSVDAAAAVARCRDHGGRVVAIGTTVVRALESAAVEERLVAPASGDTDLFIAPGYRLRCVDAVVTNFHAPGTTLTVMMAALVGPEWRSVYEIALQRGYRFLSFGDVMFVDDPEGRW